MRTATEFDFRNLARSNFARNGIGFDRILKVLDAISSETNAGYPAHDILKVGENEFRIEMAVAGFAKGEISVDVENDVLTIKGAHKDEREDVTYIHRGIARRDFEKTFRLAEYVEVRNAALDGGILSIDLVRSVPESKRPRRIDIGTTEAEAPAA